MEHLIGTQQYLEFMVTRLESYEIQLIGDVG